MWHKVEMLLSLPKLYMCTLCHVSHVYLLAQIYLVIAVTVSIVYSQPGGRCGRCCRCCAFQATRRNQSNAHVPTEHRVRPGQRVNWDQTWLWHLKKHVCIGHTTWYIYIYTYIHIHIHISGIYINVYNYIYIFTSMLYKYNVWDIHPFSRI